MVRLPNALEAMMTELGPNRCSFCEGVVRREVTIFSLLRPHFPNSPMSVGM
ncbi:hypothetical protein PTTG_30763, partial [Puccinia triticina 1-1 BBBD Race 1]